MKSFFNTIKQEFLQNKKAVITLFLLAFLARIIMLMLITTQDTGKNSVINTQLDPKGTSGEYIQFAMNLINYKTASISYDSPPRPNIARTIGYPLFLTPFLYFHFPYWAIAVFQDLYISIFLIIFYLAGKKIFNPKTILGATVFFALEPTSVLLANSVTDTENLLMPFFIGAFLSFAFFIKNQKPAYLYQGAILLALATLIRPVPFYFFVFFPFLGLLANIPLKKIIIYSLGATALFFLILSPWLIRNRIILKTWQVSSIQDYNLYMRIAANFCWWREGICGEEFVSTYNQTIKEHDYDFFYGHNPQKYKALGLKLIKNYPMEFTSFFISKMPDFFLRNSYADILEILSKDRVYARANIKTATSWLDPVLLFTAFGKLILIFLFILFLSSFFLFFTGYSNKRLLLLGALLVAYTALVSTPIGFARYRMPILLPMLIIALETLAFSWNKLKSRPISEEGADNKR